MTTPDDTTVSIAEAADLLDCTRHAVRRLIRFGSLRAVDRDDPRIERDSIDAFIARQSQRVSTAYDIAPLAGSTFSSNTITPTRTEQK